MGFISRIIPVNIFLTLISNIQGEEYSLQYGILKAKTMEYNQERKYCYGYYSDLSVLPIEESDVDYYNISTEELLDLCNMSPPPLPLTQKIIFADGTANCSSLVQQAIDAEEFEVESTVFVSSRWPKHVNVSNGTSVSMGLITNTSYQSIMNLGENDTVEIGFYSSASPEDVFVHYNLILIWIMAEFSIIVGAFWSGTVRYRLYCSEQNESTFTSDRSQRESSNNYTVLEESYIKISVKMILLFVLLMCLMLVGLWFLLPYLIYVVITLFCLASFAAVYCCLEPTVMRIPIGRCRTPYFNIYLIRGVLEVRQILLLLFSAVLPIVWFVFRMEPFSWILQDILGIAFCINITRVLRLPNLKICTLFLSLLVLYDIFFVFITPFLTPKGTSIMVDVASGGSSSEELPMVLKVPYFFYPEYYDICDIRNFSMLGFGDILVPGLLISYAHYFDLKVKTPFRLYFFVNCIAYGCGLLLTFFVLFLMKNAQPALFYLVPATVLPTVIIAAARGELSHMWTNNCTTDKNNSDNIGDYPPIITQDPASSSDESSASESFGKETHADKSPISPSPNQ